MGMKERIGGGKETEAGEPLNLSKTQFITYLGCPKQYYWKYFKGYTEPSDKENFVKGNAIHEFWENMYDKYAEIDRGTIILKRENLTRDMYDYMNLINNIVEFEQDRYDKIVKEKGLDPEKYFFPISQEERIEVEGMRGLPDAIYRREDGTLEVFDLKTSLYSGWKHKFEVLFYAKLIAKSDLYDEPVTAGCLLAVRDQEVEYHDFEEYDLKEFEGRISEVRRGIENRDFPACGKNWCQYDGRPPEEAERKLERIRR